jgi:hypothetical protein
MFAVFLTFLEVLGFVSFSLKNIYIFFLNVISTEPAFVFRIDRYSVYTG